MSSTPAGTATASTNDRVAARLPAATYPPSTEPKETAKPTTAVPATASHTCSLRRVATAMSPAPPTVRAM